MSGLDGLGWPTDTPSRTNDESESDATDCSAGWLLISTAPKDGTHIIVADFTPGDTGFGWCGKDSIKQPFADVAHWFDDDNGEKGFYPSSYGADPEVIPRLTHWQPINPLSNR